MDADAARKEKGPAEAEPDHSHNQPTKIDKFKKPNARSEPLLRPQPVWMGGGAKAGAAVSDRE
jgi:hypothetical protein